MMDEAGGTQGQMQRGLIMMNQGRYLDAAAFFREALAQNPLNGMAFNRLAICQLELPAEKKDALPTITRALECEPNEPLHHAVKAFVLLALHREGEALAAAREAVALDPHSTPALHAETQALMNLARWADAEAASRRALALDADDSIAANQLATTLRLQNKMAENAGQIAGMLARDPEDASTHANAGWAALQRGDRKAAEQHFMEALRLDPGSEWARRGLLDSFRARSPLYRAYLAYSFFMQRFSGKRQIFVIVGAYVLFKVASQAATAMFGPLGLVVGLIYVGLVFWIWIARGVGNFILLFDRFARHALYRSERWEAIAVGGGALLGVLGLCLNLYFHSLPLLLSSAGVLIASIPFSLSFTNPSLVGRWLFGVIGSVGWLATLAALVSWVAPRLISPDGAIGVMVIAAFGSMATTWLGNIPSLRR